MSPKAVDRLARGLGWLLTPVAVWAASFFGAWIGARLTPVLPSILAGAGWMLIGGVMGGAGGLAGWILYIRLRTRQRRRAAGRRRSKE